MGPALGREKVLYGLPQVLHCASANTNLTGTTQRVEKLCSASSSALVRSPECIPRYPVPTSDNFFNIYF